MQRKNNPQPQYKFSPKFDKDVDQAPLEIQSALREDPESEILRNHALINEGKTFHGLWSINVTDDWRAIYRNEGDKIIFIMLRTHENLYNS